MKYLAKYKNRNLTIFLNPLISEKVIGKISKMTENSETAYYNINK
jgi:hypothetical protein